MRALEAVTARRQTNRGGIVLCAQLPNVGEDGCASRRGARPSAVNGKEMARCETSTDSAGKRKRAQQAASRRRTKGRERVENREAHRSHMTHMAEKSPTCGQPVRSSKPTKREPRTERMKRRREPQDWVGDQVAGALLPGGACARTAQEELLARCRAANDRNHAGG